MRFWPSVIALLRKDLLLEWRLKYAISGILLYMLCIVFILFLTFSDSVSDPVWVVLFWIVILFTAVNAVAKSFLLEGPARQLYYYTVAGPHAIILAKIIYNMAVMLVLSALAVCFYGITCGFPIVDDTSFMLALLLGATAFAVFSA
ncbi:MAG: hypothetical protein R2794_01920 [Chitinophagales bacterium]